MFCKYCGTNLDDDAKFCYKCGKTVKDQRSSENLFITTENNTNPPENKSVWTTKKKWSERSKKEKRIIGVTLVLSICLLLIVCFIPEMVSANKNSNNEIKSGSTSGLTYNNFARIQDGMTYSQVCSILGKEGKISTQASSGDYSLEYYTWESDNPYKFVIITVGFENGQVCAKSQVGLE